VPIIGDLKDANYMDFIIERLKADVIFHTAAYKHVPMTEENPVAAIENNVFGTYNLISAAQKYHTKRFVLVTTDKAVDPVSVYGVSKYLCEQLVMNVAESHSNIENVMAVRFGNVLGSRGSIMPLLQKQIEKGGPVTITHPEMRRWFMTIPEACSLVLKAGGVGENENLYLLDMGEPLLIKDIAEQMIRFYGFEPDEEIKIEYIGLRKGERLGEALWADDETPEETPYPRILKLKREQSHRLNIEALLEELKPICYLDEAQREKYRDRELLRNILKKAVPSLIISTESYGY
jgi:FlaA1/EpsC-like NDP-sugar epimerase